MSIKRKFIPLAAMLGLTVAFTGGARGAASADSAAVAAAVEAAKAEAQPALSAPSEWMGPTSGPKPQAGKKIAVVSCAQLTEGCNRPSRAAVEAAKRIGWTADIFDGQGDVGKQLAAINAAVDSKYDAIVLIIVDPVQNNEGVQRALAAHIPVITLAEPPYTNERKALMDKVPDVSHDWLKTGQLIGDYMIWKSNGEIDALLLNDPEVTVVNFGQFAGTNERLTNQKTCPGCKVTVENFTIATLNTQPAALAAAAVQRDPKINWVWCYDFCMANVSTDLIARGLQGKIQGAGFDCNAQNLGLIKDGQVQSVCIADPRDWEAWAAVDTANRLIQGQSAASQSIPVRLFDKSNLGDLTEMDLKEGWQGGIDYKAHFLKIWGVQ
jgi:ribose transport system substrate-binding protein